MNSRKTVMGHLGILSLLIFLLLASTQVTAQWWRFGADAGEPVFSDLLFNHVNALRVDRSLNLSIDDLDSGKVVVRGRAEVGQGSIGRVEASLDDGISWVDVPINDRGMFAFEFSPRVEDIHRFRIRALSTTGQMSNENDYAFEFKVVREDSRALARQAFESLLERYMARDRSGFMALVSDDFAGNISAMDSALSNDFRFFDSIRIVPNIQRMTSFDNKWTIHFNFNRQVRSIRSGELLRDQASTSLTLIRDGDAFRLHELSAPLIFGVSDPQSIATFVEQEAIGSEVISVDRDGTVSKSTQRQDVVPDSSGSDEPGETSPPSTSDIRQGTVLLNHHNPDDEGYSLRTYSKAGIDPCGGSFAFGVCAGGVTFGDEVEAVEVIGNGPINSVTSVPAEPNGVPEDWDPVVGRLYGLKLTDGTYAVVRVAAINTAPGFGQTPGPWISLQFEYRHQRNGTPRFN